MDATDSAREHKKLQLLRQLAEVMVEEEREQGTFVSVPHYSVIERAAHRLGKEVSQAAQARAVAEVAAKAQTTADCPTCHQPHPITTQKRTVTSLDGPVELLEVVAHCPACRRDFFPSA